MLLTGRCNEEIPIRDYDLTMRPLGRLHYVQELLAAWGEQFKVQNFSSRVPTQKWQEEKRNIRIGNIMLLSYETKSKAGTYRLGVVVEVELEEDGLVRTVFVTYSLLREVPEAERLEYKGITKKTIRVPVQRLVLIVPVEEQEGDVYGPDPSNAKIKACEDRKGVATSKGNFTPAGVEGVYEVGSGDLVLNTKVPETTMLAVLVTYNSKVSVTNDTKDLVTNDTKDSMTNDPQDSATKT